MILDTNPLSAFFDGDSGVGAILRRQARAAIPVISCDQHFDVVPDLDWKSW